MSGASASDGKSPIAVVEAIYGAFAARDIATVFRLLAPDVEMAQSTELPWGGIYRGHVGAREFFGKLTGAIDSTVSVERLLSADEKVVAIGWTRGTVNASGARYDVPFAHVWEVSEGVVQRVEFYIDNPTMRSALDKK